MNSITFYKTVGIIFLLIAVLHALRLILGWEATIGGVAVPMWLSAIAVVVAGYLAYQSFRLKRYK